VATAAAVKRARPHPGADRPTAERAPLLSWSDRLGADRPTAERAPLLSWSDRLDQLDALPARPTSLPARPSAAADTESLGKP
jgi:hypothetical protein